MESMLQAVVALLTSCCNGSEEKKPQHETLNLQPQQPQQQPYQPYPDQQQQSPYQPPPQQPPYQSFPEQQPPYPHQPPPQLQQQPQQQYYQPSQEQQQPYPPQHAPQQQPSFSEPPHSHQQYAPHHQHQQNQHHQQLQQPSPQPAPQPPTHAPTQPPLSYASAAGAGTASQKPQSHPAVAAPHPSPVAVVASHPTPAAVKPTVVPAPTAAELSDLAAAAAQLWNLDANRLVPGKDYELNLQAATKVYGQDDMASEPLFKNVRPDIFQSHPTFSTFFALLDNYHAEAGVAETVGAKEIAEQNTFLIELMKTAPIQYVHKYLQTKNLAPADPTEFRHLLKDLWFTLYKREVANDSSAFEHTFVGEIRTGQGLIGFHNWIQFVVEERKGRADYRGFVLPRGANPRTKPSEHAHILSFQLSWQGQVKPVSTFFIGTSPEFELALYTLCFFAGTDSNPMVLDDSHVAIKCHKFNSARGPRMGSCYAESG
ncbi:Endoribonuclease XendoU-domain-containing protein [Blyttiomyces helicus]|uniref:Endoribonuclease XendoU-domain-containing protein n=1 Tax=Blyttiomyces helicus TaxID=388810 RepID=A0A4P9VZY7_9FUNG|nr:Endoribonuclease XendoU-domain-containing protein [Blyttiomyces helicus]|eukprot:RKO84373.1 Endoribonuclease XendoU-domain-containing protein [Blyttiomyces helicus]